MSSSKRPSTPNRLLQLSIWLLLLGYILLMGEWNLLLPAAAGVTVLFLTVIGVSWVLILRSQGGQLLVTPLDTGLLAILVVLLLATFFSLDPSRSLRIVWQWTAVIVVYYVTITAFHRGWSMQPFVKALLITLFLALLVNYLQLFLWGRRWVEAYGGTGIWPPRLLRVWGITNSPNTFAIMLNMALMPALVYGQNGAKAAHRPLPLLVWFALALPMLIIPSSRSGWLAAIVGGGILWWGKNWLGPRPRLLTWRKRLEVGSLLLIILLLLGGLIIWLRPDALATAGGANTRNRLLFWQVALDMWQTSPWLGTGPDTYASYYLQQVAVPPATLFVGAHNIFMNVLAEMGLAGLAALLLFSGQLALLIWRDRRSEKWDCWTVGLLASLAAFLVHTLFDVPEPWIMFLAAVMLAMLIHQLAPVTGGTARRWQNVWVLAWLGLVVTGFMGWRAASLYGDGLTAVDEGDWTSALAQFTTAQSSLPYDDTAYLLATGFTTGMRAAQEPIYLQQAVTAHRQLVDADPGWSVHRANLAALYWQQGESIKALAAMKEAIDLSPTVPTYYLNLGLWYEALGDNEAAAAVYSQLYDLPATWREAPFWGDSPVRQQPELVSESVIEGIPSRLAINLTPEDTVATLEAMEQFQAMLRVNPHNFEATFALGIAHVYQGQDEQALLTLRRSAVLEATLHSLGLSGPRALPIQLWQTAVPGATPEREREVLAQARRQSVYGPGRGGAGTYTRAALSRLPLKYDLLPQLACFTTTADLAAHLEQLRRWQLAAGNDDAAARLAALLAGRGDGLTSCFQES